MLDSTSKMIPERKHWKGCLSQECSSCRVTITTISAPVKTPKKMYLEDEDREITQIGMLNY